MQDMYNRFIKTGAAVIVVFLAIYLGTLIDWVFKPVEVLLKTLFVPIIITGVLFYLFRPVINWLNRRMPRTSAILLLYVVVGALIVGAISVIVPELQKQFFSLVDNLPRIFADLQRMLSELQQHELVQRYELGGLFQWEDEVSQIGAVTNSLVRELVSNTAGFVGAVFNLVILAFVVPFMLFYLLKEGEKLPKSILRFVKPEKHNEVRAVMAEMDVTLGHYIKGLLIVCSFVGVLCYVAFISLGLEYALMLAIFAMIMNVIPYVGPWIGTIPAVIVGFLHSPLKAVLVLVLVFVIQQVESYFVQPQVMGKKLAMHPVTVLILVLVAGRFAGIVGMLLAVPSYAVAKVIVTHLYSLWKIRKREEAANVSSES